MNKHAQVQREYRQRMKDAGYKEMTVWVPKIAEDRLRKYVAKLVKEWAK